MTNGCDRVDVEHNFSTTGQTHACLGHFQKKSANISPRLFFLYFILVAINYTELIKRNKVLPQTVLFL